ncbi:glycine zipper 2TM domain-containing protein [Agaribacterium haliotis]|uniref:glycine zipper 2TM domain-containing protein n=1 Tax=Agaribacterium haliotis TaxID=2013869 RepID=UPI000BB537D6|nr:glycine zipper 2TM domain-containing protein [Agaribacterium haliotis]
MKNLVATLCLLGAGLSPSIDAQAKHYNDLATVTRVSPVYETVERRVPSEHCWTERVALERRDSRSATPTLVGGIIGGVIGNEVGRGGDNKKIGAVVGSLLGASIANDVSRRSRQHKAGYQYLERCETTHHIESEERLKGYDVDYRYHGRHYSTFSRKHPGKKIRVAVDVRPALH